MTESPNKLCAHEGREEDLSPHSNVSESDQSIPLLSNSWEHSALMGSQHPAPSGGSAQLGALLTFASRRLSWRPHGLYETQQVANKRILWKQKHETEKVSLWIRD